MTDQAAAARTGRQPVEQGRVARRFPFTPKLSGVATIPSPKWWTQSRLTSTRAVSGWPGCVSQSANARRLPLVRRTFGAATSGIGSAWPSAARRFPGATGAGMEVVALGGSAYSGSPRQVVERPDLREDPPSRRVRRVRRLKASGSSRGRGAIPGRSALRSRRRRSELGLELARQVTLDLVPLRGRGGEARRPTSSRMASGECREPARRTAGRRRRRIDSIDWSRRATARRSSRYRPGLGLLRTRAASARPAGPLRRPVPAHEDRLDPVVLGLGDRVVLVAVTLGRTGASGPSSGGHDLQSVVEGLVVIPRAFLIDTKSGRLVSPAHRRKPVATRASTTVRGSVRRVL